MEQVRTGERRTRDLSWGDARARALMHALAGEAATRTGFRVCAIEVVRPKGLLEFVAIHGDPISAEDRLGTASRLSDMQLVFAQGEEHGHFLWIPFENLSEEIRERIDGVIVVPDIPTTGEQGDWHPMDMLVARIADERGDLRALLYLDVPSGPLAARRRAAPRDQPTSSPRSCARSSRSSSARSTPTTCGSSGPPAGSRGPTPPATTSTTCCARPARRCSARCPSTSWRSGSSSTRTPAPPTAWA